MIELGPHASFIVAAYGVTFLAIAGLVLATVGDDLKQRRLLADLERQGIKRRSAAKTSSKAAASKPARAAAKSPAAKRKSPAKPRARKSPS